MPEYEPVPVQAARDIAETYQKSVVIILAWDPAYGALHTTTYGRNPQEKAWAAQGGVIATKALGGLPEIGTEFEDYRLAQAGKLFRALKQCLPQIHPCASANCAESGHLDCPYGRVRAAVLEAEGFIG